MAKVKKASLADRLKTRPVRLRGSGTWFSRLDSTTQAELLKLREEFQAGAYKHSKSEVHEFCVDELGITIKRHAFVAWLDEKPHD